MIDYHRLGTPGVASSAFFDLLNIFKGTREKQRCQTKKKSKSGRPLILHQDTSSQSSKLRFEDSRVSRGVDVK